MATYSKTYRATAAPSVGSNWTNVEDIYDNDVDSYAYRASGGTSATHINGFGIDLPNDAVLTSLEIHSKVYAYSLNGTNGYICIYLLSDLATSDSTKRIDTTQVVNGASFPIQYVTQTYTADELTAILNSIGLHNGNPIEFLKNLRVRFVIGSTSSSTSAHCRVYDNYVVVNYKIPGYIITVNASTGGTVTGGGEYESGTTATLTATPSTGYRFKQWSDGDTSNPRTVTVSANATYTAQFEKLTYTVSVSASPTDGGTVKGGGTYEHGSNATLTASAFGDYKFTQWSDGNTDNPRTVTVLANATYTAEFEVITYTVSVSASPTEGGTVTGGGVYETSKVANLQAIPNEGYKFVGWSNGLSGSFLSIRVYEDVSLVAYFEKEPTSNIFVGTQRVTAYCGTQIMPAYCGTQKMS